MSNRELTNSDQAVYSTDRLLEKITGQDYNTLANERARKSHVYAHQRIGREQRGAFLGKRYGDDGNRIEYDTHSKSRIQNFIWLALRGHFTALWWLISNDVVKNALPIAVLSQGFQNMLDNGSYQMACLAASTSTFAYVHNDPRFTYVYDEMDVPLSVKEQLEAEIAEVEAAQKVVNNMFDHSGFMGPFLEEKPLYDTMERYAIRRHPDTCACAHHGDRVDLLTQRAKEANPHEETKGHKVFVYFSHVPNPDGSRGQRVHISHSLNDMDVELNVTPQHIQNVIAAQPVPRP